MKQPSQRSKDLHFRSVFRKLLQEWQEEQQNDPSLPAAEELTERLWGDSDGWTPYMDLSIVKNITPDKIITAIEMFISEYHDSSAWDVMDAWVRQWPTHTEHTYWDLWGIVEMFESVIYNDYRPDLED